MIYEVFNGTSVTVYGIGRKADLRFSVDLVQGLLVWYSKELEVTSPDVGDSTEAERATFPRRMFLTK